MGKGGRHVMLKERLGATVRWKVVIQVTLLMDLTVFLVIVPMEPLIHLAVTVVPRDNISMVAGVYLKPAHPTVFDHVQCLTGKGNKLVTRKGQLGVVVK
jgi:hypothetical protein